MFFSTRLSVSRTSREVARKIRRHICKTSSVSNSDAIFRQHKLRANLELDGNDRTLSTIQTKVKPPDANQSLASEEESRQFTATFPDIVRDLTDAGRHTDIPEVTKRFAKVLQYNVPPGGKIKGLLNVVAYKMFEKPENLTPENIRLANVLGWCSELLTASILIIDDIMDHSEIRRGVPCWFRDPNVGLQAANDAFLVECGLYQILKKYFSSLPCYVPIVELFHDITLKTSLGQSLDVLCMKDNKPRLDVFDMNRYLSISKYKTGYFLFEPVASAMFLANIFDEELHRQAKTILSEIGTIYQIQDDFLDCFGNPEVTGQKGSDIKDGKCSWLAVVALQRASPAQKKIMEEHYGRPEEASIAVIRNLYEELSLPSIYATDQEKRFNIIRTQVHQISKKLPHELFFKLLKHIYKPDR